MCAAVTETAPALPLPCRGSVTCFRARFPGQSPRLAVTGSLGGSSVHFSRSLLASPRPPRLEKLPASRPLRSGPEPLPPGQGAGPGPSGGAPLCPSSFGCREQSYLQISLRIATLVPRPLSFLPADSDDGCSWRSRFTCPKSRLSAGFMRRWGRSHRQAFVVLTLLLSCSALTAACGL